MGAVTAALAGAARGFGAQIRTGTEVAAITTSGDRVTGVDLVSGAHVPASTVVTTVHPWLSFLKLIDPRVLPAEFVADIRGWQSRSGTVKVNLALDRLPKFASHPAFDPQVHGGTIVLAESLDEIETSFQQAVAGCPSATPFADICIPSGAAVVGFGLSGSLAGAPGFLAPAGMAGLVPEVLGNARLQRYTPGSPPGRVPSPHLAQGPTA